MELATNDDKHLARLEKKAKSKVTTHAAAIINKHFSEAIHNKEAEIDAIEDSILEAQKALHLLRYGSVSRTYSNFKDMSSNSMDSLHPAVKALVAGKCPKNSESQSHERTKPIESKQKSENSCRLEEGENKNQNCELNTLNDSKFIKSENFSSTSEDVLGSVVLNEGTSISELPGYVGPSASNVEVDAAENAREPRGHQHKLKRRFVIGNVSKWIECNQREDSSTHKWMLYVRGCKKFPDVSDVISKVRFFIHQTYAPNNVIDVAHPPYHLIRRGWGEFPARVQIHFKDPVNKPVDIMHNIKLDKTYTGLQTLGAETLVDIWLHEVHKEAFDEPGSVSTTPNSTRPNSPFEGISIPETIESTTSSEADVEDFANNIELDVGKDEENTDRSKSLSNPKSLSQETLGTQSESKLDNENDIEMDKNKSSNLSNDELMVPAKKLKIEANNGKASKTNTSVGTRSAKVKPGTSLLLKRK